MAPLNFLGQDDRNEVQHDFFGHVIPLALVSCDVDSIFNGIIGFLRSRQLKLGPIVLTWSCGTIGISVGITPNHRHWCQHWLTLMTSSMLPLHSLCQHNWNGVHHVMSVALVLASYDTDGVINGTITFPRLRWPKLGATWCFRSHDIIAINITWHQRHHQCHTIVMPDLVLTGTKSHAIPLNNYLNMKNAMVSLIGSSASFGSKHAIAICISKR